jgi:DNA-binding response OmpR family regulator
LTARDGRQGLDVARARRPGVIVTDLMMGELHGVEVVQGADGYVVKPFKSEELLALIERLRAARQQSG